MRAADRPAPSSVRELLATRDRATLLTSVALLVVAAASWIQVVSSAMGDSQSGASHAATMDMMRSPVAEGLAFVLAWAVMMAAMMLPSALPMIALYGAIQRRAVDPAGKGAPVILFALVYLVLWAAVGIPVYVGGLVVAAAAGDLLPYGVALVLVAAGAYQFSPLKHACLRVCRSPLGFLLGHWRAGYRGSLAVGWAHAAYCLGCCWALMVVLVAAGAMGMLWVLLIAGVVAAEKLVPRGEWIARAAGGVLILIGVAVVARPDLAAMLRGGH